MSRSRRARRYSASDYRDRLYREIARRKRDAKEARAARERAAAGEGAGVMADGTAGMMPMHAAGGPPSQGHYSSGGSVSSYHSGASSALGAMSAAPAQYYTSAPSGGQQAQYHQG